MRIAQQPFAPPQHHVQHAELRQQLECRGLGETEVFRVMDSARLLHGTHHSGAGGAGRDACPGWRGRVQDQADIAIVRRMQREARRLLRFQRQQGFRRQQRGVLGMEQAKELWPQPFGGGEHAFGPAAIAEPRGGQVLATPTTGGCGQPEVPVLEAVPHGFVEAQPARDQVPADDAAGIAVVGDQELQEGEFTARGPVHATAEFIDIGIDPTDLGCGSIQRCHGPRQHMGLQAVIGIEEMQRAAVGESPEDKIDAGIAGGGKPAIGPSQQEDPSGIAGGKVERGACAGRIGAAIVHDDDGRGRAGCLVEDGDDRFRQEARLLVGRDDNRKLDIGGSPGFLRISNDILLVCHGLHVRIGFPDPMDVSQNDYDCLRHGRLEVMRSTCPA